jgi:transposase-like protein
MTSRQLASEASLLDSRAQESESQAAPARAARTPTLPCSHCASDQIVRWGNAHGLPRFRCTACRRTFNILTNTPLAHLRNRERWLTYVGTMVEGKSIRGSATACAVSPATSSRWRHRFLNCSTEQRTRLLGAIVAAYSNSPALIGASPDTNSANLSWCKELLPVVLSWLV